MSKHTINIVNNITPNSKQLCIYIYIYTHTAWTAVLVGNRKPGVPLNDWLDYMHALAYSFIQAGTSKQRKKGLSVKQRREYLSVIGKQISDGEEQAILRAAPAFGENNLPRGTYDLNDLRSVVAQNISTICKSHFKYCKRIRDYVTHTYQDIHHRELPDHMRPGYSIEKKTKSRNHQVQDPIRCLLIIKQLRKR